MLLVSLSPKITPLSLSTTSRFRVTGHSETSALNDPKMPLNTTCTRSLISV